MVANGSIIHLKKGFDICLEGAAGREIAAAPMSETVDLKPTDFKYLTPKLLVEAGSEVLAGQPLFFDKNFPDIKFCSPVSGIVSEIVRGDKRRLLAVRVIADKNGFQYFDFQKVSPSAMSSEAVRERILESGCWPYIVQRPFSCMADPSRLPKAIFVSCFDSSPLAPDLGFLISQEAANFYTGLEAVAKAGGGCPVHLGLAAGQDLGSFAGGSNFQIHRFAGPHPAGNVGVQIHHTAPIQSGEIVWTLHPQDLIIIGRLFNEGRYRADRLVAVTGANASRRQYFRMLAGQSLDSAVDFSSLPAKSRVVEGNVLHGKIADSEGVLSFSTNQISVLPEGDEPEFLGWLLPGFKKLSLSRTFFSWLAPKRTYNLDTNTHGEERAFVVSGQYEKVLPMDILPVYLLKAILAKDIERMEQLGIYEVAPEDLALCEFVCTSKIEVQKIIEEGLELMRKES